jgi:ribose transport system permease protein
MEDAALASRSVFRPRIDGTITLTIAIVVLAAFLSVAAPGFLTVFNLTNVLRQISLTSIMAIGFGVVVMTGGMDISMGSVAALVGMFAAALVANLQMNLAIALALALVFGLLIGLINGVIIAYLRVPPFIETLAMLFIVQGTNFQTTNGFPIFSGLTKSFLFIGQGYLGPLPMPFVIMAVMFLVMHLFLEETVHGQHIYAVGGNEESARVTGVNVAKVKLIAYAIAGLCAAVTGIVMTARLGTAQPAAAGLDFFLTAMTAAVLGGVALTGGEGNMLGIFLGALFLGILANGLTLLKVSSYSQWIVTGMLLILSIVWNSVQKGRRGGEY